jgi:hypothetical protein
LQNIDEQVASTTNDPTVQMGILMMAQVLTFRRILAARQVVGRGQRMKFIALAVKDFERKLRQYHETKPGQVLVDDGKPDALTES